MQSLWHIHQITAIQYKDYKSRERAHSTTKMTSKSYHHAVDKDKFSILAAKNFKYHNSQK